MCFFLSDGLVSVVGGGGKDICTGPCLGERPARLGWKLAVDDIIDGLHSFGIAGPNSLYWLGLKEVLFGDQHFNDSLETMNRRPQQCKRNDQRRGNAGQRKWTQKQ